MPSGGRLEWLHTALFSALGIGRVVACGSSSTFIDYSHPMGSEAGSPSKEGGETENAGDGASAGGGNVESEGWQVRRSRLHGG